MKESNARNLSPHHMQEKHGKLQEKYDVLLKGHAI